MITLSFFINKYVTLLSRLLNASTASLQNAGPGYDTKPPGGEAPVWSFGLCGVPLITITTGSTMTLSGSIY